MSPYATVYQYSILWFLSFMEIQEQELSLFDLVFCFVDRMWLNYWKREWSPDFPIVKFIFLIVRHFRISLWYLRICCSWMQSFLIKHFQAVGIIILRCVHLAFFALNLKCKKIGSQSRGFIFYVNLFIQPLIVSFNFRFHSCVTNEIFIL